VNSFFEEYLKGKGEYYISVNMALSYSGTLYMFTGKLLPTLKRNVVPLQQSPRKLLDPYDESTMLLWNVSSYLAVSMV